MRVLVTGGCGFIGSHLADRLVAEGHAVTVLDDLSSGKRDHAPASASFTQGDVADPKTVQKLVSEADAVFHLAAIASIEKCQRDWLNSHRTNLTGTVTLFEASAKAGGIPVIYASSAAVYGDSTELPLTETSQTRPLSTYGVDKLACEQYGKIAWDHHAVPNVGLRFFNVYGPRQDASSPYSGVISKFMAAARTGKPFTFFGDGEQTRDFIYVGDIVELLMRAWKGQANCEVFNGCTGVAVSIKQLASTIAALMKRAPAIEKKPPRAGDIKHSLGSPLKAGNVLDFTAGTSLNDGLAQLAAWEMAHA